MKINHFRMHYLSTLIICSLVNIVFFIFLNACNSQSSTENKSSRLVGGPCEGCEAIYEYGDRLLNPIDTISGFHSNEPKLKVEGTIFQKDGKTPAKDVILYFYHTNKEGIYTALGNDIGWGKRHGMHRGWIKTGGNGQYEFYTFRPGAYPDGREPEHIHMIVKEPDINEYYIDNIMFKDDTLLTSKELRSLKNRAGSGVVQVTLKDEILEAKRDIILGMNIPNYK